MNIVTSVISIAIIITDTSQMKSRILCLSIVQPLCCDQFESLDVDSLAEDSLFLPDLFTGEDNSQLSSICLDATREAHLVLTSKGANDIEGNVEAVHFVSLVLCCVCHVSIIVI